MQSSAICATPYLAPDPHPTPQPALGPASLPPTKPRCRMVNLSADHTGLPTTRYSRPFCCTGFVHGGGDRGFGVLSGGCVPWPHVACRYGMCNICEPNLVNSSMGRGCTKATFGKYLCVGSE